MATWKKVVVSGSSPAFAALQVDNLALGQVVIGAGNGGNLTTTAVNGTGNIVATTGASGLQHSGSFSGSFFGNGSGITGVISASYAPFSSTASYVGSSAFSLTNGKGVQRFTYDGGTAVTASVSGSDTLTANTLPKWTGTAFNNSLVTDDGTTFAINTNKFTVVEASGNTTIAGTLNVSQDATFGGNLTVNGTTVFINTTNTYIKDQLIMMNSGSSTLRDAGIIFQYTTASGVPSGSALFLSSTSTGTYGRMAVAYDVIEAATSITPNSFVVTVATAAGAPSSAPTWGGATSGYGNMYVNSSNSDIYIYA